MSPAGFRPRAEPETRCARHGCEHRADDHQDYRIGHDHPLVWGACKRGRCRCPGFATESPCSGRGPVVATAPSGTTYERCACGHVTAQRTGASV